MQPAAGVGGEADHVAGGGRNLRLAKNNVEHQAGGSVRATTQLTTRAAPAAFSTPAISSSVAPVVITSSTTATLAPCSMRVQRNAPRTLRARSPQGRSVCGGDSRVRSQ